MIIRYIVSIGILVSSNILKYKGVIYENRITIKNYENSIGI